MIYEFEHQITGKQFKIDIDNKHVEGGMVNKGEWFYEQRMLDWIYKNYGMGGNYVDVGAWIGTHSLYFAGVIEADKVYAFEPVERHIENFYRNMELNNIVTPDKVELFKFGLGDKEETLYYDYNDEQINPCAIDLRDKGNYKCEVRTLDSLKIPNIKILKADVEGMEKKVLLGGEETIRSQKPVLFLELSKEPFLSDVTELLRKWGYKRKERFNATPTYRFVPR